MFTIEHDDINYLNTLRRLLKKLDVGGFSVKKISSSDDEQEINIVVDVYSKKEKIGRAMAKDIEEFNAKYRAYM